MSSCRHRPASPPRSSRPCSSPIAWRPSLAAGCRAPLERRSRALRHPAPGDGLRGGSGAAGALCHDLRRRGGRSTGCQGEPYRLVWLRRIFSNTLSQLTLVPSLVLLVARGARWLRESSLRARVEAGLLALGLTWWAASSSRPTARCPPSCPVGSTPRCRFLLPLLIVAAVRFGPGGASLSLLATALLAIGTAMSGWTPLTMLPAEDRVVGSAGLPARGGGTPPGVERAHRRTTPGCGDAARAAALRGAAVAALGGVRASPQPPDGPGLRDLARAHRPVPGPRLGGPPAVLGGHPRPRTWWPLVGSRRGPLAARDRGLAVLLDRESPAPPSRAVVLVRPRTTSPEAAAAERELLQRIGIRSLLAIPLVAGEQVLGSLGLGLDARLAGPGRRTSCSAAACWPTCSPSALARKRAEDALRASETIKSAVLESLTSHVAVLDRDGRIIAVNESWSRFARDGGPPSEESVGRGRRATSRSAGRPRQAGDAEALEVGAGIEAVIAGLTAQLQPRVPVPRAVRAHAGST